MTRKKGADSGEKPTIVVTNDNLKGELKQLGGSRSDDWNNILANQAIQTLWLKHSDEETRDQHYGATLFALIGMGPRDELEGMIAAQLLAAHNAAMECYRRAMLGEQTFEGRRENLIRPTSSLVPMRSCSTRSTATAARASRRSPWSTST